MLWIAVRLGVDDRTLAKAKVLCANTVLHLMKDKRSTAAIDAALRYADGEISQEELDMYASAAAANTAVAANTVAAADAAAARFANCRQIAAICREVLTEAVFEKVREFKK
jgi:hypothetical protein